MNTDDQENTMDLGSEEAREFYPRTLSYIPVLDPSKTYTAKDIDGITIADVVQLPPFSSKGLRAVVYAHVYELRGWVRDNPKLPFIKGLVKTAVKEIKPPKAEDRNNDETEEGWFTHKTTYMYARGQITEGDDRVSVVLYWRNDGFWKRPYTVERKKNFKVVIKPPYRQDIWEHIPWASGIVNILERECIDPGFHHKCLFLDIVEMPVDWYPEDRLDKRTLLQLYCRKGGDVPYPSGKGREWNETYYVERKASGRKRKAFKNGKYVPLKQGWGDKVYSKDGHWHLEPGTYSESLKNKGVRRISVSGILIIALSTYSVMKFKHINLLRIIRSPTMKPHLLDIWEEFLRYGTMGAMKYVATKARSEHEFTLGIENYGRYFTDNLAIEAFYKKTFAETIANGIRYLLNSGVKLSPFFSPESVLKNINDFAYRAELKRVLRKMA